MNSKLKCTAFKGLLKRLDFYLLKYGQKICLVLQKSCSHQREFVFFQRLYPVYIFLLYPVIFTSCVQRKFLEVWLCKVLSFKYGAAPENSWFFILPTHCHYILYETVLQSDEMQCVFWQFCCPESMVISIIRISCETSFSLQ